MSWDYLFTGNQPRLGKVEVFRRTETLSLTSSAGPIRAHRIPSLRKSPEVKCSRARNSSEIARQHEKNQRERHACKLLRLGQRILDSRPNSSAHEHETAARSHIEHGTHELKSRVRQHQHGTHELKSRVRQHVNINQKRPKIPSNCFTTVPIRC